MPRGKGRAPKRKLSKEEAKAAELERKEQKKLEQAKRQSEIMWVSGRMGWAATLGVKVVSLLVEPVHACYLLVVVERHRSPSTCPW